MNSRRVPAGCAASGSECAARRSSAEAIAAGALPAAPGRGSRECRARRPPRSAASTRAGDRHPRFAATAASASRARRSSCSEGETPTRPPAASSCAPRRRLALDVAQPAGSGGAKVKIDRAIEQALVGTPSIEQQQLGDRTRPTRPRDTRAAATASGSRPDRSPSSTPVRCRSRTDRGRPTACRCRAAAPSSGPSPSPATRPSTIVDGLALMRRLQHALSIGTLEHQVQVVDHSPHGLVAVPAAADHVKIRGHRRVDERRRTALFTCLTTFQPGRSKSSATVPRTSS